MREQDLQRRLAEARYPLLAAVGGAGKEVIGQRQQIFGPLAQRRQMDLQHVEAVVEVLAEGAAPHAGLQIFVRGRDDADVDFFRSRRSQGTNLALGNDAQELGL